VSASRTVTLALLLLGGCVINTRPHLPAEDGADASLTNGATRDTDGGADNVRADASTRADAFAYDTSAVGDLPAPTMCPDGDPCGSAGGGDASAPPQDSGTSIDAVFEVDAAVSQDGSAPDASRDAMTDTYPDGWPVPDGGISRDDVRWPDPADI
jgi:hypothetical protein